MGEAAYKAVTTPRRIKQKIHDKIYGEKPEVIKSVSRRESVRMIQAMLKKMYFLQQVTSGMTV